MRIENSAGTYTVKALKISKVLNLALKDAEDIASHAVIMSFSKGVDMFSEGDESDGLYIILKGAVKVYRISENGVEKILAVIAAGDLVGEMAMFGTHRRSASVRSLEKLEVLHMPQHSIESIMLSVPALHRKITEIVTERLCRANTQAVFSEAGSRARIMNRLLELAQTCGRPDRSGRFTTIPFRLTHSDLAALSGVARETATKKLNELTDHKIIKLNYQKHLQIDAEAIKSELALH